MQRLNQSLYVRKREPSRSLEYVLARAQASGSPGQRTRLDRVVESQASPLLVILHYLLKNNSTFMAGIVQVETGAGGPPDGPKSRNLAVTPRYPNQSEVWL